MIIHPCKMLVLTFQINKYFVSSPDSFFILAAQSLASELKCCIYVELQQVYFCFAKPT